MSRGAGEADQVLDGEEVRLVAQLVDQRQLVLDQLADLVGHAVGIALAVAPPRSARSRYCSRRHARRGTAPRGTRSAARRA